VPLLLGEHIGGAILFEETLYQSCSDGTSFVDALKAQGIYPGIKVDKGLRPLANTSESWCQGLDDLADRAAAYYEQGARFCKWRSVVSIPDGPTRTAVTDCAYGLARYAAICQNAGLVPIVEPEILLDGGVGTFHHVILQSKHGSIVDSQHGPDDIQHCRV
jgi:fructose-bisphosphate aldolase class I